MSEEPAPPPASGEEETRNPRLNYRAEASDILFGYLLAIAVSIGLLPLLPEQAALRYTITYAVLMGFGALSWLLGNPPAVEEAPRQLLRGLLIGLLVGLPFYWIGGVILRAAVLRLFPELPSGAILAYALFVITPAENLFFRARLGKHLNWPTSSLLATAFCLLLYLPLLDPLQFPYPATFIAVAIGTLNALFGYLGQRSGLAAAFIAQLIAYSLLLFFPTL